MPISSSANRRIVRASAVYDLVVTAAFATPWTFALAHDQISALNMALGGAALPAFTPFHLLFACLMGSIVLVWSVLRILEPTRRLGRFDGVGRFLFSTWMAWCLFETGAPVLWLFVVPEFAWGVAQWWPAGREADGQRYNGVLSRTSTAC
ncbi:hypothetical protein [Massilia sp. X63]|uniref:hypothetical protein n=1 Tax=Massilia sp. X63 TaxID=3237285 RepID=UPI0034DD4A97